MTKQNKLLWYKADGVIQSGSQVSSNWKDLFKYFENSPKINIHVDFFPRTISMLFVGLILSEF